MESLKGIRVGGVYWTNDGFVEVLHIQNSYEIQIKFLNPEWITFTGGGELRSGEVKNRMKPSIQGVGYLGNSPEIRRTDKIGQLAFDTWRGMLKRCYNPTGRYEPETYNGITVSNIWHNFENFHSWYIEKLTNLPDVDFTWQLDKDLLFPGNKIYSPEVCCLVPHAVNSLFTDCGRSRGQYPLGVFKSGNKYQAQCRHPFKPRIIGRYSKISEAQVAYWEQKFDAIKTVTLANWSYLPEPLALRLIQFGWKDAVAYYGDDARIWIG